MHLLLHHLAFRLVLLDAALEPPRGDGDAADVEAVKKENRHDERGDGVLPNILQ
jgi:hypothetical protein